MIARADSIAAAADELDRLTAQFAEELARSGIASPSSRSLYDPGSYYQLFTGYHDFPRAMQEYEETKRAQIQDLLSRARFRSSADRDNFVTSRLCEIVNRYLDVLDNDQEGQIDWEQLIRE